MGIFTATEDSDRSFLIESESGWTVEVEGTSQQLYVCRRDTFELRPIEKLRLTGTVQIRLGDVRLEHQKLGEIAYAYGEGKVGSQDVLMVVTEGDRSLLTVKFRADPEARIEYELL
jgi:hypothetical protein